MVHYARVCKTNGRLGHGTQSPFVQSRRWYARYASLGRCLQALGHVLRALEEASALPFAGHKERARDARLRSVAERAAMRRVCRRLLRGSSALVPVLVLLELAVAARRWQRWAGRRWRRRWRLRAATVPVRGGCTIAADTKAALTAGGVRGHLPAWSMRRVDFSRSTSAVPFHDKNFTSREPPMSGKAFGSNRPWAAVVSTT